MGRRYIKQGQGSTPSTSSAPNVDVSSIVRGVIDDIRQNGDAAVRKYSAKFDKWERPSFKLSQKEIDEAIAACPKQVIEDIKEAQKNVRTFAQAQRETLKDIEVEIQPGVFLGQKDIPINNSGAYIPGGRYPLLASAHMTILTAKVAGVKHVVAMTPPIAGKIPNNTVAAMHLAGADEIHICGGVQAVAAMACGTETVSQVDFLAGPGNAFVAEAKRQLFGDIGIDLLAGPTEILIVADEHADPFTVATDILSQAEHGPDSPTTIITTSEKVARKSMEIIDELLKGSPTAELQETSYRTLGDVVIVDSLDEAWKLADEYAAEHVEILTQRPREALEKMTAYGSLFLGEKTCVTYGDKAC